MCVLCKTWWLSWVKCMCTCMLLWHRAAWWALAQAQFRDSQFYILQVKYISCWNKWVIIEIWLIIKALPLVQSLLMMQIENTAKNTTNDMNKCVQNQKKPLKTKPISLNSWKHSLPGYVFTNIWIILLHIFFFFEGNKITQILEGANFFMPEIFLSISSLLLPNVFFFFF